MGKDLRKTLEKIVVQHKLQAAPPRLLSWQRAYVVRPTVLNILPKIRNCFRGCTHVTQTDSEHLVPTITMLHSKMVRVCRRGDYQVKRIANMDQAPLQLILIYCKNYVDKGSLSTACVRIFWF